MQIHWPEIFILLLFIILIFAIFRVARFVISWIKRGWR